MAKTTNHPPYEIDPWKADVTEPPSGLTFDPEIIESPGKPKQEPVPPEPTEGQQQIERSLSRIERFDKEIAELEEKQKKILDEVQADVDTANEQIKQLRELEEQIKQQVEDYTDDTDKYLREAELLRGELEKSRNQMTEAVNNASSAIAAAEAAQKALEDYKNGESERLAEAIAKAQEGVAKAAEVNQLIDDLKNSLGSEIDKQISSNDTIAKIKSDNEAANKKLEEVLDKSKKGVEDASKAIELLNSRIDIGGSLLTIIPGTTKPHWTEGLDYVDDGKNPPYWAYFGGHKDINGPLVKVDSRIEYNVSMSLFGYGRESLITMDLLDENGKRIFVEVAEYVEENGEKKRKIIHNRIGYFLWRRTARPQWQDINFTIRFVDDTKFARLGKIYFNDTSKNFEKQCIKDFRIDPLIPSPVSYTHLRAHET